MRARHERFLAHRLAREFSRDAQGFTPNCNFRTELLLMSSYELFRRLDSPALWLVLDAQNDPPTSDADRVAFAFGELTRGEDERARELLAAWSGDGSAPDADRAYVEAFLLVEDGEIARAAEVLESAMTAAAGAHLSRMRLRAAELRMQLGAFAAVPDLLAPLLPPPGGADTLEAHLLVLESLARAKVSHERLIEQSALVDGLLERGFTMREAQNVLDAVQMLSELKIEGLQDRLLESHSGLLEGFRTDDPDELGFLVAEGERRKCGALIRSAARSYEEMDIAWETSDPEAAAFQFAHHEEFEAACLVIERSFDADEIRERGDLWGPLLLCAYHAERWAQTLELIDAHFDEIAETPQAASTRLIRAVALHQSGRDAEAAQSFAALPGDWRNSAAPHEAAAFPKALSRLGDTARAAEEFRTWTSAMEDRSFLLQYLNAVLNAALADEDESLFGIVAEFLASRDDLRPEDRLLDIGELALAWSLPGGAARAAAALESVAEPERAAFLRCAGIALNPRGADTSLRELAALNDVPDRRIAFESRLALARASRLRARHVDALAAARAATELASAGRLHVAWELVARLLDASDPTSAAQARRHALDAVRGQDLAADVVALREDERRHHLLEDERDALARRLDDVKRIATKSSEIPRLERRLRVLDGTG
jgi:hypothetical protein